MYKPFKTSLLFLSLAIVVLAAGCRKTEDLTDRVNKINFVGDINQINGPIDEWLFQHFTIPYNIKVQYKWDRSKVDLDKTITPVDESKVIPIAEKLITYYLNPYEAEAGTYFVKRYPPKEYLFIGSAKYNSNGTVTLGSADAGRKVMLYRLNDIDDSNWDAVQRMLKTVHHEFAHILDQNRAVPPEFGAINKADYLEDLWTDRNDQQSLDLGFISPYAGSQKSDDFAETVAILLVYGQANFENLVASAAPQGQINLRKKEQMVIDYFKLNWDIDFVSLQQRIQDLMPVAPDPPMPPFLESFGDGLQYSYLQVDETTLDDKSINIWTAINNEMVEKTDRHIAYIRLSLLPDNTQMLVRVYRYPAGAGSTGSASYSRLYFDMDMDADEVVTFTYAESGNDGSNSSSALKSSMDYFVDFILENKFKWDWLGRSLTDGGIHVLDNDGEKTGESFTGSLKN